MSVSAAVGVRSTTRVSGNANTDTITSENAAMEKTPMVRPSGSSSADAPTNTGKMEPTARPTFAGAKLPCSPHGTMFSRLQPSMRKRSVNGGEQGVTTEWFPEDRGGAASFAWQYVVMSCDQNDRQLRTLQIRHGL